MAEKVPQEEPHQTVTSKNKVRRLMIVGGLAGAAALALQVLGIRSTPDEEPTPYRNWERFSDKTIPQETVVAMGEHIKTLTQYPGFSEVGSIIVATQKDSNFIRAIYPEYQHPLRVVMGNLVKTDRAIGILDTEFTGKLVGAKITNKRTGMTWNGQVPLPEQLTLKVIFDNSLRLAPVSAKTLIAVKEFSHFVHIPAQKRLIAGDILSQYDVKLEATNYPNLENLLYIFANYPDKPNNLPPMGTHFVNATKEIDAAGYWHIMPGMARMKDEGKLGTKDLEILSSNAYVLEESRKRGLLVKDNSGNYGFIPRVTPFSSEWQNLVQPVLSKNSDNYSPGITFRFEPELNTSRTVQS